MADLDLTRYDGHTPGPWYYDKWDYLLSDCGRAIALIYGEKRAANLVLIADAPLLLAEVTRLRAAWESAQPAPDLETWVDELTAEQGEALAQDSRWLMRLPAMAFCELLGRVANEKARRGMFDATTDRITLNAELVKARAETERLRAELAAIRHAAREYLAVSVPECAETGADLGRETWTPGYRAIYEALEQLAKEA